MGLYCMHSVRLAVVAVTAAVNDYFLARFSGYLARWATTTTAAAAHCVHINNIKIFILNSISVSVCMFRSYVIHLL